MKKTVILALVGLGVMTMSCKKGCEDVNAINYDESVKKDDGSCIYQKEVTLKFTQTWDSEKVTVDDYNDLKFFNEQGENLSLTKLQYLISDFRFYKADGDSIFVDMYHFIDLEDANTSSVVLGRKLDPQEFIGVGFNFGFTPEDNVSGEYLDLNQLNWSWPDMIGGGYHQMKMEGKFINSNQIETNYQFHNGSATKQNMSTEPAVPNYFFVKLDDSKIKIDKDLSIEINMQIEEWYKNPNSWELNTLFTMLMGNKAAQLKMSENGKSVFELGEIK